MALVLVVDDSAICREPVVAALESEGYETVSAASGEEALAELNTRHIDLVLLDLSMPGLDGFAVLRAMRRNPHLSRIPVIVLSDASSRDAVRRAAQIGIQGYLLKSGFSLHELLERADSCLGVRESGSGLLPGVRVDRSEAPEAAKETGESPEMITTASASAAADSVAGRQPRTAAAKSKYSGQSATARARPGSSVSRDSGGLAATSSAAMLDGLTPLISKDRITKILRDGLELKPIGPVVNNVIAITSNARCCVDDVARTVAQDQALSIRLLKLANSSAYSRGKPVDSVKEGIQRIGIHEVRSLVMTLAVAEQYQAGTGNGVDPRLFWEHSIACGLAGCALGRHRRSPDADEFFLWGLLHDVGRVILLEHVPDEYAAVCETAGKLDLPLEAVEARLLHFDHAAVLEQALQHWKFPSEFIIPVAHHHRSIASIRRLGKVDGDRAATIALADRLVHALLLGSSANDVLYPLEPLIEHLGMEHRAVNDIASDIAQETDNLKYAMLARSNEDAWPNATAQMSSRLDVPFRPLVAGATDQVDPCRLLATRLAGEHPDESCNIGVIWIADAQGHEEAFARYERLEGEAGCGRLPVLVVCGKGKVEDNCSALHNRMRSLLGCPVPIGTFVRHVSRLLTE